MKGMKGQVCMQSNKEKTGTLKYTWEPGLHAQCVCDKDRISLHTRNSWKEEKMASKHSDSFGIH